MALTSVMDLVVDEAADMGILLEVAILLRGDGIHPRHRPYLTSQTPHRPSSMGKRTHRGACAPRPLGYTSVRLIR